jgi:hypothetical protein
MADISTTSHCKGLLETIPISVVSESCAQTHRKTNKKVLKKESTTAAHIAVIAMMPKLSVSLHIDTANCDLKRKRVISIAVFSGGRTGSLEFFDNALAEFICAMSSSRSCNI